MIILLTIIHVIVCLLLVLAVLLQSGKGGGLASAVGGGLGSSSVLGGRSAATFLSKATTIFAIVFMVSCLVQAVVVRAHDEAPMTATERMLKEQGAAPVPLAPMPIGEGGVLPGEVQSEGAAGAAQGDAGADQTSTDAGTEATQ